ncbi:MAG: undecaprenyl-diphosphate phosphatase [Jatrophihabitans sp.]|uniref:undecaprenyl-diphosphate phosphatase n=1 Tax=Jatrophihabitans sp. TaxID=1932789 RepID=UPI003F7F2524
MTFVQAVILGLVQGLTEFLPISSTAHLRIVPALFDWHLNYNQDIPNDPGAAFTAVIQLGTTLAIVLYFWRDLWNVTRTWFRGIVAKDVRGSHEYRMGWYLILATIPIGILGLVFKHQIETGAHNLWLIASALIVLALVLLVAERVGTRVRGEAQITTTDAVAIGGAQALALIPGVSRSGSTITAGLFRGLDRPTAARFSFLLSIPAVLLSGLYEAYSHAGDRNAPGAGVTIVATIVAFVVGFASIAWLMRYIARHSTMIFIGYRIALGILLIVLLSAGVLHATR